MMMKRVGMVSLGCSKNRVDSETLLGILQSRGFEITSDASHAEIIIVNTCGFITSAKEESISTIMEMHGYKKSGVCKLLVVTGCLSQRYYNELSAELTEADILWGVHDPVGLVDKICTLCSVDTRSCSKVFKRVLTTPPYSAYLRIADGCDNRCSYCAIPLIRGSRVSVPMDELIDEARFLADSGVKELTVIAQDTSAYGMDLYEKPMLSTLLRKLNAIDGLHWIRVLYTYPNTVDEELIDTMICCEKVVNYIDIPIQHIDAGMLKRMNRHGSNEHIKHIVDYMRRASDDFIIRSTVITGFPGETEHAFDELTAYVGSGAFDRLGAFAYSQEEGTPAAEFDNQIEDRIKQERLSKIMLLQQQVSLSYNRRRVGTTAEVLVEEVYENDAVGRSYAEAPEVDGGIRFKRNGTQLKAGDFVHVLLTGAKSYDMRGEQV